MKPLIGLNVDVDVTKPDRVRVARLYYEVIEKAGGIPVLIPPSKPAVMRALLDRLDGVLLIGGRDYDPAIYGETPHPEAALLHPDRDQFDRLLAKEAIKRNMPVLGICGGHQLINIVLGGSLMQHIAHALPLSTVIHRGSGARVFHPVDIAQKSKLATIYKKLLLSSTISSHHQAISRLGRGLKAVAFATDGLIEAVEHVRKRFVVGVQWHPEHDFAGNARLFRAFILACKNERP